MNHDGQRPVLLAATRNPGKMHELLPLCGAAGFRLRSLDNAGITESPADEDAIESFATFEENALAKAHYFFTRSGGLPVLADDSGLAVDALQGAPGVHSKRWSGSAESGRVSGRSTDDANNALLVRSLENHSERRARFVCAAALVWQEHGVTHECVALGESRGVIIDSPRGTHGFGYDPHFLSDELGITFAEAEREAKGVVSHRARAVRAVFAVYATRSLADAARATRERRESEPLTARGSVAKIPLRYRGA